MTADSDITLAATDAELPPEVGEFEKYGAFEEMARGGKAVLHSCVDRIIGRTVCMKRPLPEIADDPAEIRRFLREARVTAQMAHPNTVPVYEIGRDDAGAPYFTMKKISGDNLHELLKRIHDAAPDDPIHAAYPPSWRLNACGDAGLALAYAHAHGVVHRDVKPENIWVGRFGEVILLDWGIAKVWGKADDPAGEEMTQAPREILESDQLRTLTRSGQLLGTPLYMSPEQVLGHKYLDERSDVFGLGIVMYEALTLTEPFRGRSVRSTFDYIIHDRPKPPSEVCEAAPPEFDAVVMKALEKKPDDRWQSMLSLVEAVREVTRGE